MGGGAEGMCCKGREKAVRFTSVLRAKLPARSSWEWAKHFKKAFDLRAWDNLRVGMTESRSATTTASAVDSRSGQSPRVIKKNRCWAYQQHPLRYQSRSSSSFKTKCGSEPVASTHIVTNLRNSALCCLAGPGPCGPFLVLPACSKRQLQHACNHRQVPRRSVF